MAITIRNTEEHEKMLSELKQLTNINTMSKALVEGGYLAIQYHDKYKREAIENQKLRNELSTLRRKVNNYLSALSDLQN